MSLHATTPAQWHRTEQNILVKLKLENDYSNPAQVPTFKPDSPQNRRVTSARPGLINQLFFPRICFHPKPLARLLWNV